MKRGRVYDLVAGALILLLVGFLYGMLVYTGAARLPRQAEPFYRLVEPLYERLLGGGANYTAAPAGPVNVSGPAGPVPVMVVVEGLPPRIVANISVRVPGGWVEVQHTDLLEVEPGWRLCWRQEPVRAGLYVYEPLNGTGCVPVEAPRGAGNYTRVRLVYRRAPVLCLESTVPVTVEVEPWAGNSTRIRVDGRVCLPAPGGGAYVVAPLRGPDYDAERVWWLEWYWVDANLNGSWDFWWSPVLNGSELRVAAPARVELHYYPGLRDLPYVYKVEAWPYWDFTGCNMTGPYAGPENKIAIEDGWIKLYDQRSCKLPYVNTPGRGHQYESEALLYLDPAVKRVVVWYRFNTTVRRTYVGVSYLIPGTLTDRTLDFYVEATVPENFTMVADAETGAATAALCLWDTRYVPDNCEINVREKGNMIYGSATKFHYSITNTRLPDKYYFRVPDVNNSLWFVTITNYEPAPFTVWVRVYAVGPYHRNP